MKRPLVWILLFFIASIFMGRYLQDSIALFLAASVFMTAVLYYRFRQNMILLFPISLLFGFFVIFSLLNNINADIDNLAKNNMNISLEATVLDAGKTRAGKCKAIVRTKWMKDDYGNQFDSNVRIQVYFDAGVKVATGDRITLKGAINLPDGLRNPGGFDEQQYFRSRKIQYKIFAKDVKKHGTDISLNIIFPKIREKISSAFDNYLPQKEAGIMKAIIIGDKIGIDDSTQELYRMAGIYHILAVSGLHVSILAFAVNSVLSLIFNKRTAGIIMIIFLLFYCVLTGAGIATTRAVLMSIVGISGALLNKKGDAVVTTSFAALCLLVYEPFYLWDIGFQYSFAAVYGLIIGTYALERAFVFLKDKLPFGRRFFDNKFIRKYLSGTIAATLATIPICIYHFYYFSPVSILTNLLIVPTLFILVIAGVLMCTFGFLSISLSAFIGVICLFILKVYELICTIALKIPFSNILAGSIGFYIVIAYYCVLGLMYYTLYGKPEIMKKREKYFYASAVIFILIILTSYLYPKPLEVDMLDIGQGDSIVISKGKMNFIIDGGGNIAKEIGENTGENVVVPYLNSKGISTVDAAFVTHTDGDHAIGIIETMERKRVKRLFLPHTSIGTEDESKYYEIIMQTAKKHNTEIHYLSAGDEMIFGNDISVKCVFPDKSTNISINDGCIVLKMNYGGADFLFTGDIGFEAEKLILENGADINSDVLKIAHHGSKNSTGKNFLDAVSPKIAIISAGRDNNYGHPSQEVLMKLEDRNIDIYNTPQNGAILINTDGKNIYVRTMAANP